MPVVAADPFDLPDWLGVSDVVWSSLSSLGAAHRVSGRLAAARHDELALDCDLLACDHAYPTAALGDKWRGEAHHAWSLGEVLLLEYDGRLTLAMPGSVVTAEPALEAIRRLARAVAVPAERFSVLLRL